MPLNSKTAAEPRIRTFHSKSRAGCKTCKQRRVKCDEERPICLRCRRSGRECVQDIEAQAALPRARNPKSKALILQTPKASFTIDDGSAVALEYFITKAIPFMRQSKTSPLWNHVLQLLHQEGPVVRQVAAAIGQQQRALENVSSRIHEEAAALAYGGAIRAQRQSLGNRDAGGRTVHAISCILLVVLESLRSSFQNIELHLEPCIRLLQQTDLESETRELLYDVSRIVETYLISTMSSSPLTDKAIRTRQLLRTLWAARPPVDDMSVVEQSLVSDMLTALDGLTLVARSGVPLPQADPRDVLTRSRCIEAKREALEAVTEEVVESLPQGSVERAHHSIVLARSLLTVILNRQFSRASVSAEVDLETYRRVVDLCETSLAQIRHFDSTWAADAPNAFSLGLGLISILYNVGVRCKDFYLRRRALLVLEMCPRREGVWTVEMARFRVMSVIKAEEERALHHPGRLHPNHLPEDCRIAHDEFVEVDGQKMLRLFWRRPGLVAFVTEDVPIHNWEPSSPIFSSPPAVMHDHFQHEPDNAASMTQDIADQQAESLSSLPSSAAAARYSGALKQYQNDGDDDDEEDSDG